METISPQELMCMDSYAREANIRIDVTYAQGDNLLFGERIYRKDARLWLYNELGRIVLEAAKTLESHRLRLVLYDGLRSTNAQKKMLETQRVKEHPHWLEEPRLLSPPGAGAHPRGMAIDCSLETLDGELLDMGTPFDFLAADPSPMCNPAHRQHPHHPQQVIDNRKTLDSAMQQVADALGIELLLLPQEWWDFRLSPEIYERFAPLADEDLPEEMRMM